MGQNQAGGLWQIDPHSIAKEEETRPTTHHRTSVLDLIAIVDHPPSPFIKIYIYFSKISGADRQRLLKYYSKMGRFAIKLAHVVL